jgi:HEAT repeats
MNAGVRPRRERSATERLRSPANGLLLNLMMRSAAQTCFLAATLLLASGCHSFLGYRGWPFPEYDRTSFHTPAMRMDTVRQFAARADGTDSAEQRKLTDQLARQIQIEPDPLVREEIIKAAAEFRTPLAQQILLAGLNDDTASVRVACCQALGKQADENTIASLAQSLRGDKDIDVRLAAAEALGKFKSDAAMSALVAALDDRNPALQLVGVQSLKSITGKDYGGDVAAWRQVATGSVPPEASHGPSIAERLRQVSPF